MHIETRKLRIDEAADSAGKPRVLWFGDDGETCPRCGIDVPAGYRLVLPATDVSGCLRCLELQAHLFLSGLDDIPADLMGTVDQQHALSRIAEEFRLHIRDIRRGRVPRSRNFAQQSWFGERAGMPEGQRRHQGQRQRQRLANSDAGATRLAARRPWPTRRVGVRHADRGALPAALPSHLVQAASILGLTGTPSRDEIITAFRRAALICHPDYGGSDDAFRELVAARDALLANE